MSEIHFILCEAKIQGRRVTFFVERDCDRLGFANTVDDILQGQVEGVRKVYRACLADNFFEDVSEDVAIEILNQIDHEPTGEILDYLEDKLGCQAVAEFVREMRVAA